jgi:glycosyltransferase involved in cell wall biosynthesis
VPIHRLLPAPSSNWNEVHFQKNVVNWISREKDNYDCILVDRADGLLATIQSKSSKWNLPVIARFSPDDSGIGLANSQKVSQLAMADSCRRCFRIVCTTPYAHRILVSQGISESQIVRMEDVASERITRSDELRASASNALFETSSDFVVPSRTHIVLHLGNAELKSLKIAVQSICDLLDVGVMIRMWIVGSGISSNSIYDLVKSRGWHREILLFDGFDDFSELIRIADLAIASNPKETLQYTLPLIAMAGVPLMIAEQQDCRSWLPDSNYFQLYSSEESLASKLHSWLTNRELWITMANTLRQSLIRNQSGDTQIQQWAAMFRDSNNERTA